MRALHAQGRIYTDSTIPQLKRYLDELPGQAVFSIWVDIPPINPRAKERLGYPTQKPLALLERIIKASSNPGDIVLDPFCGCATACVAADRLGRQWVGIDLSPLAAKLVRSRVQAEGPLLYDLTHRTDIPRRTDVGRSLTTGRRSIRCLAYRKAYATVAALPFRFATLRLITSSLALAAGQITPTTCSCCVPPATA